MINIETIGTGGGSIAWVSREGHLKVGPKSAGAKPGPMCYPGGGDRPTITDANLVMGRLPPSLIGGGIALDVERSRAGIGALGRELKADMSVEELAAGIIDIANWNQANRIRQMTIQRGIDPREFALLSFGGAGPVQSAAVMDLVGMKACIVPQNPGNLAAFGLLAVDWRTDHTVTRVMQEAEADVLAIEEIYRGLEAEAVRKLEADGVPRSQIRLVREADLRYAGQSMEVRVSAPAGQIDGSYAGRLAEAFHTAHNRLFGYDYAGQQTTELVNFCVSGFGAIERPDLPRLATRMDTPAPKARRSVWFSKGYIETPIYDRTVLPSGFQVLGPAVVEEFGSTTVVFPDQALAVQDHGIMIITSQGAPA
jgi:N-methylhydantoinase A